MRRIVFYPLFIVVLIAGVWLTKYFSYHIGLYHIDYKAFGDTRAERRILFIGNSHTFYHHMPDMLRKIADSAGSKERYDITTYTDGGVWLKKHWNTPAVQALLQQKWDDVVIQGDAAETFKPERQKDLMFYGQSMANMAKLQGARVYIYVPWRYADWWPYYEGKKEWMVAKHNTIQNGYYKLSQATGGVRVNTGSCAQRLLRDHPDYPLYEPDGNHGSLQGYYMVALLLFKQLSQMDVRRVTYVPFGMSEEQATQAKAAVRAQL